MSKSYYGSSSVTSPVRELEARSFADLVASYFNVAHRIQVTREEGGFL